MESPCRLGLVLLCLAAVVYCESSLSAEIRDLIGLGRSSSAKRPGAVLVFITNGTDLDAISTGNVLNDGDLLNVAGDLEQRDPTAIYAQYDGENLVTSQASLFNSLDTSQGDTSWTALVERVKNHRDGKPGSYSDLLVFESYPELLRTEIISICDKSYQSGQECKVIRAYVDDSSGEPNSRVRRQAGPTTTVAPSGTTPSSAVLTPAQRANIPLDSVAAFHLLFWTSLAIALAVWGTAYGMWHMDPGRDSIIYRMTSAQKFKKDK